ncbi:LysR family transcriptional regulator [Dactylosporangium aurantiacum]|uniref:LysR family transcriptional regulator n=1 Tax=Dactylosporangium aurantiacum TaxID=35754 RepID=A0A9Q9IIM0_9ACTN|nr:LysR substrate-binding domain-containing protein [Dactylosporangium aurantiacum]MDG6109737.1 LysR substrate-binding domain-containing protein [Dactylosporangium aurantiacum]UWZ56326.1 LysR family transcriptional regulator [Dactylosporangium aurantiacum]
MLDPWRLRLLTLLESLGTVRAVAGSARLSPSNVSEQLAVLEREAGTRLFERAGRRLRLTPAGAALVRHARVILDQMDAAREELAAFDATDAGLTGAVRLGAFTSALNTFVLAAVGDLAGAHPRLRVTVWELDPAESVAALQRGECDVVVTADPGGGATPDVVHTPLATDEIMLVTAAGADHPAGGGPADLAGFADRRWSTELPGTWTYDLVTTACRRAGFEPDLAGCFASYGSLLAHVEAGLSVTLLPELAVDRRFRVAARPVRVPMRRRITAAVRRSSAGRASIVAVVEALRRASH